jgi:transcriptional regulator with XRE-family HTH domain
MTDDASWYSEEVATFGDRLTWSREASGKSQQALAENLGVKLASLVAWENNVREPRGNRLQMLSGILGVSLGWLMTGVGDGLDEPQDTVPIPQEMTVLVAEMRTLRGQIERSGVKLGQIEKRLLAALRKNL